MFNGSLIEDLFAVVKKAEKSARVPLAEEIQSRQSGSNLVNDFDDLRDARRAATSEAE